MTDRLFFRKKIQSGFTLTEVLITIIIFVFVLITIYSAYILAQKSYFAMENSAEIIQNGRIVLERMAREIRQSREIITTLPEEKENAPSSIIFEDGHISDRYHYINYFLADGAIKRKVLGYYVSSDPEYILVPINLANGALETIIIEEEKIIGEYAQDLKFWGLETINLSIKLKKGGRELELYTKIFGRNL